MFDSASLRMAITSASPGDTITFLGDITLDADLPAVQTSITIDGAGHTLSGKFMGTVLFRGFFIGAWEEGTATQVPVTVTIQNLTIQDTKAAGGNGGGIGPAPGGGEERVWGGAIFVANLAGVTLSNVTLISNTASGGGGGGPGNGTTPGGGGGMGGHGGTVTPSIRGSAPWTARRSAAACSCRAPAAR